jgi:hypothetical protein
MASLGGMFKGIDPTASGGAQQWASKSMGFMKGGSNSTAGDKAKGDSNLRGGGGASIKGLEGVFNKMSSILTGIKKDTGSADKRLKAVVKVLNSNKPKPFEKARASLKKTGGFFAGAPKEDGEVPEKKGGGIRGILGGIGGFAGGILKWFTSGSIWKKVLLFLGIAGIGKWIMNNLDKPIEDIIKNFKTSLTKFLGILDRGMKNVAKFFTTWEEDGPLAAFVGLFKKGNDELGDGEGSGGWSWTAIGVGLGALMLFLGPFLGLKVGLIIAGIMALASLKDKVGGVLSGIASAVGIDTTDEGTEKAASQVIQTAGSMALAAGPKTQAAAKAVAGAGKGAAGLVGKGINALKTPKPAALSAFGSVGAKREMAKVAVAGGATAGAGKAAGALDKFPKIAKVAKWIGKIPLLGKIITPYLLWDVVSKGLNGDPAKSAAEMVPDIAGIFGGIGGAALGGIMGAMLGGGTPISLFTGLGGMALGSLLGDELATGIAQWFLDEPITIFDGLPALLNPFSGKTEDKPTGGGGTPVVTNDVDPFGHIESMGPGGMDNVPESPHNLGYEARQKIREAMVPLTSARGTYQGVGQLARQSGGGAGPNYVDASVTNNNYGGDTAVNHSDNSSSGGGGGGSNNSGWGKMRYLPFGRYGATA